MDYFKVRKRFIGFLAFVILLFTTSIAQAQLPPSSAWVSVGPGDRSVVNTAYGVNFSYDYDNLSVYNGQAWTFSTVATTTETITYNWLYSGIHAWYDASAKISKFVTHNGVTNTEMVYDHGVSGDFNAAGTSSFVLSSGDTYGFIIFGKNFDSNSFLRGTLEISRAPVIYSTVSGQWQNGWYTSDVALNWTVTDGVSQSYVPLGCNQPTITNDSSVTGTTYTCSATSAVGTASKSVLIKRDTRAPVTTDNAPVGSVETEATVQLTAIDAGSGVAATHYKVDNGATQTGTSVHIASDGIHTISYWSVDNLGHIEATKTATVEIHNEIFHADIVSPTKSAVTLTLSFPVDAQLKQVSVDNQISWTDYTAPIVANVNQTVYAKFKNAQGIWSQISSYVINNIDKVAPTTTIDAGTIDPATKYVTLNLTAEDTGSGIMDTFYTVDNGAPQTGNSIELRTQGMHVIKYWSVDSVGNIEIPNSKPIKVELLPIQSNGQFSIEDVIKLILLGTLQQKDMNDDGEFTNADISIMLNAITPIATVGS